MTILTKEEFTGMTVQEQYETYLELFRTTSNVEEKYEKLLSEWQIMDQKIEKIEQAIFGNPAGNTSDAVLGIIRRFNDHDKYGDTCPHTNR